MERLTYEDFEAESWLALDFVPVIEAIINERIGYPYPVSGDLLARRAAGKC